MRTLNSKQTPQIIILLALMTTLTACSTRPHAELLLFNGTIHVMDSSGSTAEAMAVVGDRIAATGPAKQLRTMYTFEREIDLDGAVVFPGFIDAHAHLYGLGEQQQILDLTGTADENAILALVRNAAASGDGWIRGRGWDQNDWPLQNFPDRKELDAICPDRPVFLVRVDGHAAWVNTAALRAAGIAESDPDPAGGRFQKRADGSMSGVLVDNAVDLVKSAVPAPSPEEIAVTLGMAVARCSSVGLTGMHDMGMRSEQESVLRRMIARDALPLRIVAYLDGRGDYWERQLKRGREVVGAHNLVLAGLKLYADGALGSRGARLLEDYSDDPGNRGLLLIEGDTIAFEARRAALRGLQVCVHAIGDGANRLALDAYETAAKDLPTPHPAFRIEHVQVLAPQDIPRFAALGVIPSMQPTHCTSDMRWAESRLGPSRIAGAYAWRSILRTGAMIPGGSDFPIESPDPLLGIYAAAFRVDRDGKPSCAADIKDHFSIATGDPSDPARFAEGWYGSERMSRREAVLAFTARAAQAGGCGDVLGSLIPGKYADFVILSEDILDVPRERFLETKVLETWVGGKRVYTGSATK